MSTSKLDFKFERVIPASPEEVFDAWLNPETPGTPWNESDKLILNPQLDGLWYWNFKGKSLYGRFVELHRPMRMQYTWVSPNTLGLESIVTLTFQRRGEDTLMTLVHSDLPDHELAKGHENGWGYFLDRFPAQFAKR
ncbi:MAG: SRPBCC domain-containing protein [Bdellovibrionales bacterium]|nr:SRPBCC domain-containing protein [Bdellovibrionales bacterium]